MTSAHDEFLGKYMSVYLCYRLAPINFPKDIKEIKANTITT